MLKVRTRPPQESPAAEELRVAAARKKFLRRQRARRWLVWRRILAALAAVGIVAGLVWLFFFSSLLVVRGAEVRGVEVLTDAAVQRAAAVPDGVPLVTVDLDAIEARVEGLAAVESAEASRGWPHTVRIEVTERTAVAAVEWEGQWRGLDATGVLFRSYPSRPTGLPRVAMTASTPAEALAEAAAVVQALPSDLRQRVDHVEVQSIDRISLALEGGATVTWGSADESDEKAAVLRVLLENGAAADGAAKVYDVTAPGRPTTRG